MTNPRSLDPRSAALLATLARLPRFVLVIAVAAVFVGGLFLPGLTGALLLGVIIALAAWLAWLTWPMQPPGTRLLRIVVIGVLVVGAVSKLL